MNGRVVCESTTLYRLSVSEIVADARRLAGLYINIASQVLKEMIASHLRESL